MYKIQTLNKISIKGLEVLGRENYEVASEINNPDGIILRSFKMHEFDMPSTVKAVARAGAGVNNIPVSKYTEKGVVVFNTPGANANGVKELVIAGLFLSSRKVYESILWAKGLKGKGDEVSALVEKGKSNFVGPEVKGKTLGVIGLGAIGVMVANDAENLGMDVVGFDPYISVEAAWGLSKSVKRAKTLDVLLPECDYITLHIPLNDKTKGMINATKLELAKDGVRILNFSRGELVANKDIIEAVKSGKVSSYVTDFPTDDLLDVDNIIPLPHLGASTPEAEDNCAVMAARQMKDFLENGNIKNSVNFPDCEMPRSSLGRLIIANKNIPNMVSQITKILAERRINISNMINNHKNDVAYNIIDIDSELSDADMKEIQAIEGIIMCRIIR